jgi:hypothetical protein
MSLTIAPKIIYVISNEIISTLNLISNIYCTVLYMTRYITNVSEKRISAPCPGKRVCSDPRSGDATFGVGGPGPPATDNGSQLSLDRGEEKT